jgi:hypothetical protein
MKVQPYFMNNEASGLIIHESSLLQMRGTRYEGVILHCECLVTKQMQ